MKDYDEKYLRLSFEVAIEALNIRKSRLKNQCSKLRLRKFISPKPIPAKNKRKILFSFKSC